MTMFGMQNANNFFQQYGQNQQQPQVDVNSYMAGQNFVPTSDPFYGAGYRNNATGQTMYGNSANQLAMSGANANGGFNAGAGGMNGANAFGGGGQGGFMGQAANALRGDIMAQQGAADRQWNRVNNAGNDIFNTAQTASNQVKGGNANFQPLIDQQKQEFQGQYDKTMGEFKDRTTTDAAALSTGIQRKYQQQMKQIDMGINADGTMMTPAQKRDAQNNIHTQMGQEVNSSIGQVWSQYNQQRAQLNQQYGQLQDSLQSRTAQLTQQQAALNQVNQLQSAQMLMQGRQLQGQYIQSNPESVVSIFSALSALGNIASSGGGMGRSMGQINF